MSNNLDKKNILVIGEQDIRYLTWHVLYWFKILGINYQHVENARDIVSSNEYDFIIFIKSDEAQENTIKGINTAFINHILDVHNALLLQGKHFVYIDTSMSSLEDSLLNQKIKNNAVELVKDYSKFLNMKYTILYLYDLIGYKNTDDLTKNHINIKLEWSHVLRLNNRYDRYHFVYIWDFTEAIANLINNQKNYSSEEHLRYDDNGSELLEIARLFETVNGRVFSNIYLNNTSTVQPFKETPSKLLIRTPNPERWVKKRGR